MNATIKTLEIVVGDKTVPLSKLIVNQLPFLEGKFADNSRFEEGGDCEILGDISLPDGPWIIVETPHGLQRTNSMRSAFEATLRKQGKRLERIILTK